MFTINTDPEVVLEGLTQIGANIQKARREAFAESTEAFASRLGCSMETVELIEAGDPGVPVIYVLAALQVMQSLADVVAVTSPKLLIATHVPVDFPAEFTPSKSGADIG